MKPKLAEALLKKWEAEDEIDGRPPQSRPTLQQLIGNDDLEYWWEHSPQARMAKFRMVKELIGDIMRSIYPNEYLAYNEIEPYENQWKHLEQVLKKEWFRK